MTRYRKKLIQNVNQEKNRIHKILQDANIKLTTFITDIFGVSGRALLGSIIEGEVLDEQQIRNMVKGQVKSKVPELIEALNGRLRLHHRNMLRRHHQHMEYLEKEIQALEFEIDSKISEYNKEMELLLTIPGVGHDAAASIMAEIGTDMTNFPTEERISSWAGVCPANHVSNGKKKSKKNKRGNRSLKSILCQCSWAAIKKKNSRIGALFNRLVKRMGKNKAIMAVAHCCCVLYTLCYETSPLIVS